MAMGAGTFGLVRIYLTESPNFKIENPWIAFNVPAEMIRYDRSLILQPITVILAVAFAVAATVVAVMRTLPTDWKIRKSPLREWTWPALVVTLVVLAVWFGQAVTP